MEVDSLLVAVERSIEKVEEQIKAVEDQLKNEQDPDEKKYLREEKKQLRKEEQLREKEKQLREKELLLLKSTVPSEVGKPGPAKAVQDLWAREVKDVEHLLREAYRGKDVEALSKPDVYFLPVPSMHPNPSTFRDPAFEYVGRSWFQKLHGFVMGLITHNEPLPFQAVSSKRRKPSEEVSEEVKKVMKDLAEKNLNMVKIIEGCGNEAYILGTPGEGMSYGLAVLAGLLRVTDGDLFATVYISARSFVVSPYLVLQTALLLAFSGPPSDVADLERCVDTQGLLDWLGGKRKSLILVDDFNDLDEARSKGNPSEAGQRSLARSQLRALTMRHVVVFCSSASSMSRLPLTRRSHQPYLIIGGGFSDAEFKAFTKHRGTTVTAKDLEKSGTNPRLLQQLVDGELDSSLTELEADLGTFLGKRTPEELSEFMEEMAGGRISRLPQAMDSRCFVPKDGKLMATSDYLQSAAYSKCVQLCTSASQETQEGRIRYFVQAVKAHSKNASMVGWNAEEATLLAIGSQTITIGLDNKKLCWRFKASRVLPFKGGIAAVDWVGNGDAVFHVPTNFNCQAVDCLLEGRVNGKKVAAGVQISVSRDPQGGAIQHFCEKMATSKAKYDLLAFIWIGYFPDNDGPAKITVGNQMLTEVTLSFGSVHRILEHVDRVLGDVRETQVESRERAQCRVIKANKAQCLNTVAIGTKTGSSTDADHGPLCHCHRME